MNPLFLITARGGSKGIPGKNIKSLGGKPLLHYSIELARKFVGDEDICLSTDSNEIADCAKQIRLKTPFMRPAELATDTAGSHEVILHALDYYRPIKNYDSVVLLQPTSPFRLHAQVKTGLDLFTTDLDAVISVKVTRANPYNLLYKLNGAGFMEKLMEGNYTRRQDVPEILELNGAFYILNAESIRKNQISRFKKVKPLIMPEENSVDLDTALDWNWAEFLLEKKIVRLDY